MNNLRNNAIKLLIQGFKFNLVDSFDDNIITKICSKVEEHINRLCKDENMKKYRTDINNFNLLLKNKNNYEIKIEYLKGSITEDEFINKIYNNKTNFIIKNRQLSKDKIYSPNIIKFSKERRVKSQNKLINIEKEINENHLEKKNATINVLNNDCYRDKTNKNIKINNPFNYENKVKDTFNNDNNYMDEINYNNILLSTNNNENIQNIDSKLLINQKEKLIEKKNNNIIVISKNVSDSNSLEKIKNEIMLSKDNNNIKGKRNKSSIKEKSVINSIEIEIENKKLSLENEQLKNKYNNLRKELLKEKENNLKLTVSYEKILLDNSILIEKINKLEKKIVKLKKLNEMYNNNYNEIKQKLDYKNKTIDKKLEKLTQNFNIVTTKFLDSSISKINFNSMKNNFENSSNKINNNKDKGNIKKSCNIISKTEDISDFKNQENGNINKSKKPEENDKNNGLFESTISYRSYLEKLNESYEKK